MTELQIALIRLAREMSLADDLGDVFDNLQDEWERAGLGEIPEDDEGIDMAACNEMLPEEEQESYDE